MNAIINLTPHQVTVVAEDDTVLAEWPASGAVARLRETQVDGIHLGTEQGAIPTDQVTYADDVTGLPPEQAGTLLIVSRILAAQVHRADLYFPSREVRDEQGRIIGCRALGQFASTGGDDA